MSATILFQSPSVSVLDYRCEAGPADAPFAEEHLQHSISFVRRGTFGLRYRGSEHELVEGAVLLGHAGDEYCCVHDHHVCGDECLSFQLSAECVDTLGIDQATWRGGALPPLADMMILGQLGQAAAEGRAAISLGEVGLLFAARLAALGGKLKVPAAVSQQDQRRAVQAAAWIAAHASEAVDLEQAAAHVHLSPFHFLRLFGRVLGVTPHQYLVRTRLAQAAGLLAAGRSVTGSALDAGFQDLSNFVRTFHKAAGIAPKSFQDLARNKRKIFQEKLALPRL